MSDERIGSDGPAARAAGNIRSAREQLLDHGDTQKHQGEVKPYRAQLNIFAAHMDPNEINAMLDGLEDDAIARGFVLDWSFVTEIPAEDVPQGSTLDLIVKGKPEESEGGVWPANPPQQRT